MMTFKLHDNIHSVLIVEDNTVTAILMESQFRQHDMTVTKAFDGQEAWDRIKDAHFDLLLVDLNIPVIHGRELILKVRKLDAYKQTPIIAVSAGLSDEEKTDLRKLGFSGCMNKPIRIEADKDGYQVHGEN